MDSIYLELDEAKAEIEKLRADYKKKADLSENLKKAQNEQEAKVQKASLIIEKQAQELNEKEEELSFVKHTIEDLKDSLHEKECVIRRLNTSNDKLRAECNEKLQNCEEEKRTLVSALEEVNEKKFDQERHIRACKDEIEELKRILSASMKKCSEVEKKSISPKEEQEKQNLLLELEDGNRKIGEQLKWKKEQFKHLEEAHDKVRNQFRESKKEWELEKSSLFDDISLLQTSLDSQTRISEDLQKQLQMCNHALAHEESRRKYLEVQVSNIQTRFDNVFNEYQDSKSQLEFLTAQRDEEIASLRHLLRKKETIFKEMEYQAGKLEHENHELRASLRELQEAQIQEASLSSVRKRRSKLKNSDQICRESTANLRAKEAEWSLQIKKMEQDINNYKFQLEMKDATIKELRMEFDQNHGECTADLEGKENESSQMEKMTGDLHNNKHDGPSTNFEVKEAEWRCQLESLKGELNKCMSELEKKDASIEELRLEKMTGDLHNNKSELECRDELEHKHDGPSTNFEVKEAEWRCQLESLKGELNKCMSELEKKDASIEELRLEFEDCHSLNKQLKLKNEEIMMMLLLLKLTISEAQLKVANEKAEMECAEREKDQNISRLMHQLEMKNISLVKAQTDIEEAHDKEVSFMKRIESLNLIDKQQHSMQQELDRYKEMLIEASKCELSLKEQVLKTESGLRKRLKKVCDDLDIANIELGEKICEANEIEFELHIWRSIAERLKSDLEESHEMRKQLESSLLAQVDVGEALKQEKESFLHIVKEKDKKIDDLQQQIELLELKLKSIETGVDFEEEQMLSSYEERANNSEQIITDKDEILEQLQKEIAWLEQETLARELESFLLAQIEMETIFEVEQKKLTQFMEHKNQRVNDLMQLASSLENKFNGSLVSFSSQLAEKQAEINMVHEAWEKITTAEIMAAVEIEEKKLMITVLENDIRNVQQKLEMQQKSLCDSKQQAQEVEAKLEAKELEMNELRNRMKTKLRDSDALIEELRSERKNLLGDVIKLSSERENLLGDIGGISDKVGEFSSSDQQLTGMLERIMLSFDNYSELDGLFPSPKKHADSPSFMKKFDAVSEMRSPFRELNSSI